MRRRWAIWVAAGVVVVLVVIVGVVYLRRPRAYTFALVPKALNSAYYAEAGQGCSDEARKLPRVTCQFVGPQKADSKAQVQILEQLVREKKINGLAVAPVNAASVVPVIKKATAAGIRVITFDTDVASSSGRLAFVGTDDRAAGIQLASLLAKMAPAGGTYAILTGDPISPRLNDRIAGVRAYLGQIKAFQEMPGSPVPTNGDTKKAVQAVAGMISANPKLSAIVMVGGWPLFDPAGYRNAVKSKAAALRSGKFVVVAFDMFDPELQLVRDGYVSGLIGQRPYQMGGESIRLLYELTSQNIRPPQTRYHSGIRIVTKDNVSIFLR